MVCVRSTECFVSGNTGDGLLFDIKLVHYGADGPEVVVQQPGPLFCDSREALRARLEAMLAALDKPAVSEAYEFVETIF